MLLEEIEQICKGLVYISDTDAEVHAFEAPNSVKSLTTSSFLKAINVAPLTPIQELDFTEFFEHLASDETYGEQWAELHQALLANLADRAAKRVFKVGNIQVDIYAVGLYYPESQPIKIVGIKTFAVET